MRDVDIFRKINRYCSIKIAESRDVRLNHQYLVIESDDWGSLRMPSLQTLSKLTNDGLHFFTDIGYDKYDTLESDSDIEILLETCNRFYDYLGKPLVITMNGVVANPDFNAIRENAFTKYIYETVDKTYQRNSICKNVHSLLKEGLRNGSFKLQFHGREHLNVCLWMRLLAEGNNEVINAFDNRVWSLMIDENKYGRKHCLSAFDVDNLDSCNYAIESLNDGLQIFENLYGYKPLSMIAPNYTWDEEITKSAFKAGIKILQGNRIQKYSIRNRNKGLKDPIRFIGQKNFLGQIFLVRNCLWEPSQRSYLNSDLCFKQICKAFAKGRPAIISAHRLNFIGTLNENNRKNNISDFKRLLNLVLKTFPKVRFVSSDELGIIIQNIKK